MTIGSGVFEGAGVEFPTFPLTCVVVLKTLWHYRASVWWNVTFCFYKVAYVQYGWLFSYRKPVKIRNRKNCDTINDAWCDLQHYLNSTVSHIIIYNNFCQLHECFKNADDVKTFWIKSNLFVILFYSNSHLCTTCSCRLISSCASFLK